MRDLAHIPELRRGRIWSWALARAPSATQEAGAPCAFHLPAVQPPGFIRKGLLTEFVGSPGQEVLA